MVLTYPPDFIHSRTQINPIRTVYIQFPDSIFSFQAIISTSPLRTQTSTPLPRRRRCGSPLRFRSRARTRATRVRHRPSPPRAAWCRRRRPPGGTWAEGSPPRISTSVRKKRSGAGYAGNVTRPPRRGVESVGWITRTRSSRLETIYKNSCNNSRVCLRRVY